MSKVFLYQNFRQLKCFWLLFWMAEVKYILIYSILLFFDKVGVFCDLKFFKNTSDTNFKIVKVFYSNVQLNRPPMGIRYIFLLRMRENIFFLILSKNWLSARKLSSLKILWRSVKNSMRYSKWCVFLPLFRWPKLGTFERIWLYFLFLTFC